MAKNQTIFVCSSCGNESSKWLGKCPACGAWNSFYEEKVVKTKNNTLKKSETMEVVKLNTVEIAKHERYKTKCEELDRVLGGGLVQGSLVLLGGEPRNTENLH